MCRKVGKVRDGDVSSLCFQKMGWVRAWIQDLFCQREEGGVGDDMWTYAVTLSNVKTVLY